jgi:hypothetical protein
MADKTTHFGRAGEFFAMSELLLLGWNVAVPVVDIGDDVFVIDDNDKTTYRLQVKSAQPSKKDRWNFSISRAQLRAIEFDAGRATGWGANLDAFLGTWPSELPVITEGPGARA